METIEISNQTTAAASKKMMEGLFSIGAGKIVENTLSKVISFQLSRYRDSIDRINSDLKKFETAYKMSSEQFYQKFEEGELGDDEDFFEWSGLYENVRLFKKRIEDLDPLVVER
jgi:hypothetical protein